MKNISRIFSAFVCSASLFAFDACGAVATTAGSDLTGFNPSNSYNNQWATATNARYDGSVTAKADFGNCNALIMRCAQPKCANGGCSDMNIAANIVAGCVKSNSKCKQYGDDLIQFMSAQLVADSTAKVNASNAEQIAAAQAAAEQAQMAAQQAAAAQQQQMAQMQSDMQQQMMQMQQQMAEQNAQSAQQIADALAQSQQQQAAAISEMQSAAQNAARAEIAGGAVVTTPRVEAAIERGVSEEVLAREQITGQIVTELENAKTQLQAAKATMEEAFRYAKCDDRGNNCGGPKRVKKWRELASGFMTPYDGVVDSIYDALITAQSVGVDMSDIYMMLNNSCNSWGEYLCPPGERIVYDVDAKGQKGQPQVCDYDEGYEYGECVKDCRTDDFVQDVNGCVSNCRKKHKATSNCQQCTLLKILNNKDDVYAGWIDTENESSSNQKVIACASQALSGSTLFSRKMRAKNGAGLVDIEKLDRWINQKEPVSLDATKAVGYCWTSDTGLSDVLQPALISKTVEKNKNASLCVQDLKLDVRAAYTPDISEDCAYIRPVYAICDTHVYNINKTSNNIDSTQRQKMNEVIAAKITVISQQMYKQYEYLNATLRRLKTQLSKSVLTAQLQMAGAQSDGSSGNASGSSYRDNDKAVVLAGAENCSNKTNQESAYSCLQNNISLIITNADSNSQQACKQLRSAMNDAVTWKVLTSFDALKSVDGDSCKTLKTTCNKKLVKPCAQALNVEVSIKRDNRQQNNQNMRVITLGSN